VPSICFDVYNCVCARPLPQIKGLILSLPTRLLCVVLATSPCVLMVLDVCQCVCVCVSMYACVQMCNVTKLIKRRTTYNKNDCKWLYLFNRKILKKL